jgi:hypothetical protein
MGRGVGGSSRIDDGRGVDVCEASWRLLNVGVVHVEVVDEAVDRVEYQEVALDETVDAEVERTLEGRGGVILKQLSNNDELGYEYSIEQNHELDAGMMVKMI